MDATDAAVIDAVLAGEVDRYAELVNKYQAGALKLALSLVSNYDDANDASQEAFVSAYRALGRFRRGAKFSTWLYRIVVNECKDVYRRRARQPQVAAVVGTADPEGDGSPLTIEVEDSAAGPGDQLANRELSRRLGHAIEELGLKQRTAFVLHHVEGLPLDEVAGVMRCRVGTVKSHLFRATAHLRSALAPWMNEEASP